MITIKGAKCLLLGLLLSIFGGSTAVLASPWVEADDVYLRASLQQLADAGYLQGNMATFPLMWSGIARDLRNVPVEALNENQRLAYHRVRAALNFAQQERVDTLRLQGSSERIRTQGFGDTYYEHGSMRGSRAFVGDHTAGRLQTNIRAGTPDNKYYTFDGSYLATTLGNWAFSVDAMPVWWGPGQENALVLSTNSRPIQAFRFNRLSDDSVELPGLSLLGNWSATGFFGRTQSHGPLGDQEIAGGRMSIRPTPALTVAGSYMVETGGRLGSRRQIAGLDGRLALPYSLALYGEVAERQGSSRRTGARAYTFGADHYLRVGRHLQQLFVEYTDVPAFFYDDTTDPVGYRRWQQSMGAGIDQDVESWSIGYRFQRADGSAWRLSYQDQVIGGSNRLVVHQHSLEAGRFELDRQVVNVKFQQALGETLVSFGVTYMRDKISETLVESTDNATTKHDLSVRVGWEFRY